MSAAKAMRARLTTDSALVALVGPRIFPGRAAQDSARPYMIYSRVSTDRPLGFSGLAGINETRLQIDIIADSQATAEAIAVRIRATMDGYLGTSAGVLVLGSWVEEEQDNSEPLDGSDSTLYRVVLDVILQVAE